MADEDTDPKISDDQLAYLNANHDIVRDYVRLCKHLSGDPFDNDTQVYRVRFATNNYGVRVYMQTPSVMKICDYEWCLLLQFVEDHNNTHPIFK